LWLVDRLALAEVLDAKELECPRLSSADIARAESMAAQSDQRAHVWRAGRIALRLILERIISETNRALAEQIRGQPFEVTAHGEPSLRGVPFTFSQSDSGKYLLIGVAIEGRIGVDLEEPRKFAMSEVRQAQLVAVARFLSVQHSREPLTLLQAWTRIEAFAKARGPNLARVLTELGLIGVGVQSSRATDAATIVRESELCTRDLLLPHGLVGALSRPTGFPAPILTMLGGAPDLAAMCG
jgi:phosphopantetheinyl transferase